MQKTLFIGTLNCQNREDHRKGSSDHAKLLADHIEKMHYDLLGTQELTKPFLRRIEKFLDGYSNYGDYRYGDNFFSRHLLLIKEYNENNNIFVSHPILKVRTHRLPWFPKSYQELSWRIKKRLFAPRIATVVIAKFPVVGTIAIINTHLDYGLSSIQKRQLDDLLQLVRRYHIRYPVIVMGDFNMQPGMPLFDRFVESLNDLGINRVPVNQSTHQKPNKTIDHIFVPVIWNVIESGLISSLDQDILKITDHKGVYIKIQVK